jgi:putative transposase
MPKDIFEESRKSLMETGQIYFWTATINQWQYLLQADIFKDVIIDSLRYLSEAGKVDVFSFVIMPNHIHLIWRMNDMNGKESSYASFLKYTAHSFKKLLKAGHPDKLEDYKVYGKDKVYEFWQRDSLAIQLYSREVAFQKLDYIHNNPLAEHWVLARDPNDYTYSSCRFYEMRDRRFGFLKDLREEF